MEIRIDLGLGQTSIGVFRGKFNDSESEFVAIRFHHITEPQEIGLNVLNKNLIIRDAGVVILSHNIEGLMSLKKSVDKAVEIFNQEKLNEPAKAD